MGSGLSSLRVKSGKRKNRLHKTDSTGSTETLARQLSLLSSKTLGNVADLVNQFGVMEAKVLEIEDMLKGNEIPTRDELCISRDALAQAAGKKLYGVGVMDRTLERGLVSSMRPHYVPVLCIAVL